MKQINIIKILLSIFFLISIIGLFYTFSKVPNSLLLLPAEITGFLFMINIVFGMLAILLLKE